MPTSESSIFQEFLKRTKDIDNYKADLDELKRLTSFAISPEDINFNYHRLAGLIPFSTIPFFKKDWENEFFFRVRTDLDISKENIYTKAPFTYPPVAYSGRNLRASPKDLSVFYCSNCLQTAIRECKIQKLKTAYIGVWKLNLEKDATLLPFISPNSPVAKYFPNLRENEEKEIRKVFEQYHVDVSQQIREILNFAADSFMWDTETYTLSSWLSQRAFELQQCDVVMYPSYITKVTVNLAFSKELANNFVLERVYQIGTNENHEGEKVDIDLIKVGERKVDSIVWRPRNPNDRDSLQKLLTQ